MENLEVTQASQYERENEEIEIDLIDLVYFYRTKLKYLIAAFVLGALLTGCVTQFAIAPKYTATSTMYMVSASHGSALDLSQLQMGQSLSNDYVELMMTRPIINAVKKDLNLKYKYDEMVDMIELTVKQDTRIVQINVTSTSRKEARDIANTLALETEENLPKVMDAPKPNIAEHAVLPEHKSSPSLTKNTLIGALLFLLLMLAYFTIRYLQDDTVKSSEDVEKYFGIMPLTVIPESEIKGLERDTSRTLQPRKKSKKNARKGKE